MFGTRVCLVYNFPKCQQKGEGRCNSTVNLQANESHQENKKEGQKNVSCQLCLMGSNGWYCMIQECTTSLWRITQDQPYYKPNTYVHMNMNDGFNESEFICLITMLCFACQLFSFSYFITSTINKHMIYIMESALKTEVYALTALFLWTDLWETN